MGEREREREKERKKGVSYCTASSLVGVNIKTRIAGILRGRNRSLSSNGSAKAAVWKKHKKTMFFTLTFSLYSIKEITVKSYFARACYSTPTYISPS